MPDGRERQRGRFIGFIRLTILIGVVGLCGAGVAADLVGLQFAATDAGRVAERVVAFATSDRQLISVVLPGHRAGPVAGPGGRGEIRLLGHDPVSRLAVLDGSGVAARKYPLGDSGGLGPGAVVRVAGGAQARVSGWARRHGGRVLPVSLLRVNYPASPPAAGTPLLDEQGRVVAIGYQAEPGRESVGYALPVEVVSRVLADLDRDRRVVRTWLGVTLREGAASPSLVRVEAGSPAERGGLLAGDVLLRVGARQVSDYAEVVDAFYYLVAGERAPVRVLRGVKVLDVEVVPQAVASGVGAAVGS